jgi:hypothetical protein
MFYGIWIYALYSSSKSKIDILKWHNLTTFIYTPPKEKEKIIEN